MNRSQVMQTLSYLSDVIGPRFDRVAQRETRQRMDREKLTSWGLQNGHWKLGSFRPRLDAQTFSAQIVEPQDIPLIAYPKAWSPGIK